MSETQLLILTAIATVSLYLLHCLYLRNLSGLLKAVRPVNRAMPPGQVWLLLLWGVNLVIDFLRSGELKRLETDALRVTYNVVYWMIYLFLLVWQYRVIVAIAASIEMEYKNRSLPTGHRPTYRWGFGMVLTNLLSTVAFFPEQPILNSIGEISSLGYVVFWIIYWVNTHRYRKKILAMPGHAGQEESAIFSDLY